MTVTFEFSWQTSPTLRSDNAVKSMSFYIKSKMIPVLKELIYSWQAGKIMHQLLYMQ